MARKSSRIMKDTKYNQKTGEISYVEFVDTVKPIGNSGRISVHKELVGKKVHVSIKVL